MSKTKYIYTTVHNFRVCKIQSFWYHFTIRFNLLTLDNYIEKY